MASWSEMITFSDWEVGRGGVLYARLKIFCCISFLKPANTHDSVDITWFSSFAISSFYFQVLMCPSTFLLYSSRLENDTSGPTRASVLTIHR